MKSRLAVAAILSAVLVQTGCYTTRIQSDRAAAGASHESRQWFTIAGLVPLSGAAGRECPDGLAYAESKMGGWDIAINFGLGLVGGAVGASVCTGTDANAVAACVSGFTTLIPFLIASRTVQYTCAGGGAVGQGPLIPGERREGLDASGVGGQLEAEPADAAGLP